MSLTFRPKYCRLSNPKPEVRNIKGVDSSNIHGEEYLLNEGIPARSEFGQ